MQTDRMEKFRTVGYYICEYAEVPDFLYNISEKLLSVSGCIGENHPKLDLIWNNKCWLKSERQNYIKKLRLSEGQLCNLFNDIGNINNYLDIDSRFTNLPDAVYFFNKYFSDINCTIVSVSTSDDFFELLSSEMYKTESFGIINGKINYDFPLGYDILGWDHSGFHSFLCNSLHKEQKIVFNEYGLITGTFSEIISVTKNISGLGKPVEWIPCMIGIVNYNEQKLSIGGAHT